MVNTAYQKGVKFERDCIHDLENFKYTTIRAAGSKGSGKVDIIAVRQDGMHLWIQCKTDGKISIAEWNRIRKCSSWVGAIPILASISIAGRIQYEELLGVRVAHQPGAKRVLDVRAARASYS